jgi:hypothetical protein
MNALLTFYWRGARHRLAFHSRLRAELVGTGLIELLKPADIQASVRTLKRDGKARSSGRPPGCPPALPEWDAETDEDVVVTTAGRRVCEISVQESAAAYYGGRRMRVVTAQCASTREEEE